MIADIDRSRFSASTLIWQTDWPIEEDLEASIASLLSQNDVKFCVILGKFGWIAKKVGNIIFAKKVGLCSAVLKKSQNIEGVHEN